MNFEEYRKQDATALAALVASKEVTAAELLEVAQARCEAVNPQLNAVVTRMAEQAAERSTEKLKGPFAGVPFLIKDIAQDYAGVPTTSGSRALKDYVPPHHSELVARFLNAGTVIFGKTNTPELALKGVTEPELFGPTRNPWDLGRTPGGSSGGAGAAVAGGIVPMAGASDGGGSIRIPAAYCGLFGLRPGRGRVPAGPPYAEFWEGASSEHVLSRSVRDSAAMLDAIQGADLGAPFVVAPPRGKYLAALAKAPRKLKIGYNAVSPLGTPVDPEAAQAVAHSAKLLESLGHTVEEAAPGIDGEALARCYLIMYFGQVAADMAWAERALGVSEKAFEPETRALGMLGRSLSAGEYVSAHRLWNTFSRAMADYFQRYDFYLTPTVAQLPSRIGEQNLPRAQQIGLKAVLAANAGKLLLKTGIVDQLAKDSLQRVPFTQLSNLSYTPSMSVPLYWTANGLPLGVQFIAPVGQEAGLLQLAAQLEQAQPWFDRVAPI